MLGVLTAKTHDACELSIRHVVNVQHMQALGTVMVRMAVTVRTAVTVIIVKDLLCEVFSSSSGRVSISSSGPPIEPTAKHSGFLPHKPEFATRWRVPGRQGLGLSDKSESVYSSVYQTPEYELFLIL